MTTSLYNQSIPVFTKYLKNLSGLLDKAAKFADEQNIKHEDMLNYRLVPDMKELTWQVQTSCDTAKFVTSRVAGMEKIVIEDNETTFDQLKARIQRTIDILATVKPEDINSKADSLIIMETKTMGDFKFETGQDYVTKFAIPNFHFHFSTAYCLLRHRGVPLQAFDYLGADTFVKAE